MNSATIIIPAYNEEFLIENSLERVVKQKLPNKTFRLEIIVVPNGCVDKTEKRVDRFIQGFNHKQISIRSIPHEKGHKGIALNIGINAAKHDLVITMDSDSIISDNAVTKTVQNFNRYKKLHVLGAKYVPNISLIAKDSLLAKFELSYMELAHIKPVKVPIGRYQAFRKSEFPSLPTDLADEDFWVVYESYRRYGIDSVRVDFGIEIHYVPPQNWTDMVNQKTRWIIGMKQLFEKHPMLKNLEEVENKRKTLPQKKLLEELGVRMKKYGTTKADLMLIHKIRSIILKENSIYMREQLIDKEGKWSPNPSTKRIS